MGLYVRKPNNAPIEAVQFTGENIQELWDTFGVTGIYKTDKEDVITVLTSQGQVNANANEWITPDSEPGRFYPIKDDVFQDRFEDYAEAEKRWSDSSENIADPTVLDKPLGKVTPETPTHMITLAVMVGNPNDWTQVFSAFTDFLQDMGDVYPNVQLSSTVLTDDESSEGEDESSEGLVGIHGVKNMRWGALSNLIDEKIQNKMDILENVFLENTPVVEVQDMSCDDALDALRSIMRDEGLSWGSVNDGVNRLLRAGVVVKGPVIEREHDDHGINVLSDSIKRVFVGAPAAEIDKVLALLDGQGVVLRQATGPDAATFNDETLTRFRDALLSSGVRLDTLETDHLVNHLLNNNFLIRERS